MDHEILGGAVWTDERGEAVVVLPDHLHDRELEYEYRLESAGCSSAVAELVDGRLTIKSTAPHVKVAWRLVYCTPADAACERRGDE